MNIDDLRKKPLPSLLKTLTAPLSLSALVVVGGLSIGCEEEQVSAPKPRARIQPKRVTQPIPNAVDLSVYRKIGNGPAKAPDWISSQDFSLMRRYSLNAPTGFRNGNEFTPKGVWVERRESGWFLVLNEKALDYPTQLIYSGERIEIPLTGDPSGQYQIQVERSQSEATWRVPSSPLPGKTSKWESKSDFSLELLQWSIKSYDTKGPVFQEAGKASGRLMIQFIDDKGVQGWVVGKFEDVLVRYMGNPAAW